MSKAGILFVVSGPSGTGKTTLCRMVEERLGISHSVSYTTRPPRGREVNGKDYHFLSEEEFQRMIDEGAFLEWAPVHGFRYGTAYLSVKAATTKGQDLILDLDTQGALTVKSKIPDSVLVFVDAPDQEALAERLGKRGTEDYDKMRKRLAEAERERAHKDRYDYALMNEDLEKTYQALADIIEKEHAKRGDL